MKSAICALLAVCLCLPLMGDEKEDKEFYEKIKANAVKGDALAQYDLGLMYYHGKGVLKDVNEAVKWWAIAAIRGQENAQYTLGVMYSKGEGVLKDDVTAYAWYNIAAANGSKIAKGNKPKIAKDMTPEQIAKARELSREMIKKNPKLLNK